MHSSVAGTPAFGVGPTWVPGAPAMIVPPLVIVIDLPSLSPFEIPTGVVGEEQDDVALLILEPRDDRGTVGGARDAADSGAEGKLDEASIGLPGVDVHDENLLGEQGPARKREKPAAVSASIQHEGWYLIQALPLRAPVMTKFFRP